MLPLGQVDRYQQCLGRGLLQSRFQPEAARKTQSMRRRHGPRRARDAASGALLDDDVALEAAEAGKSLSPPATPRALAGSVSKSDPATPTLPLAPRAPETGLVSHGSRTGGALACFRPAAAQEEEEEVKPPAPPLPSGAVGLRNHGNMCFLNTAVQVGAQAPDAGRGVEAEESAAALDAAADADPDPSPDPNAGEAGGEGGEAGGAQQAQMLTPLQRAVEAARERLLRKGELAAAFMQLVRELCTGDDHSVADPIDLLRCFAALPLGAELCNGGQHDCQDALRQLLDALHDDLQSDVDAAGELGSNKMPHALGAAADGMSPTAPPPTPLAGTPARPPLGDDAPLAASGAAAEGGRRPKLSVFKGMTKAAAAAAAKLADSERGVKARAAAAVDESDREAAGAGSAERAGGTGEGPDEAAEEGDEVKAERSWAAAAGGGSLIHDLFRGQLQSTIECQTCKRRSTMYDVFWELSLPLAREAPPFPRSVLSSGEPKSVKHCLEAFFAGEKLEGGEAFFCTACKRHTTAIKTLRLHRLPRVLLLHIKRFKVLHERVDGGSEGPVFLPRFEKLTNSISFPVKDLKLGTWVSEAAAATGGEDGAYDLFALAAHQHDAKAAYASDDRQGHLGGGHYKAVCRAAAPGGGEQWLEFDDAVVRKVSAKGVAADYLTSAYIFCFARKTLAGA
ncbi:hypothetical protein WJX81_007244 [Elliptochloris bilobata]|uniref:ubiquitinyl hydrolase 1 n=1 Tax=Elliptochloris bilobata TaxID=381761 RepID=A0AAW1RC57_9CHLO